VYVICKSEKRQTEIGSKSVSGRTGLMFSTIDRRRARKRADGRKKIAEATNEEEVELDQVYYPHLFE